MSMFRRMHFDRGVLAHLCYGSIQGTRRPVNLKLVSKFVHVQKVARPIFITANCLPNDLQQPHQQLLERKFSL